MLARNLAPPFISLPKKALVASIIFSLMPVSQGLAQSQELEVVQDTHAQISQSQQQVEQLDNATRKMLQEYQDIMQRKDYQQYYQFQLQQLKQEQNAEIARLESQLQELAYIELALMPLMQSMLLALEEFIALDLPFKQQERLDGLQRLRQRINSTQQTLPDKYRLMMEAWQIEQDYGRSIETWRGVLEDGKQNPLAVDFLRIGRIALYYQTPDAKQQGRWDSETKSWQRLPEQFSQSIQHAMRVASDRIAPELLALPLPTGGAE